jgi:hypothetical protein
MKYGRLQKVGGFLAINRGENNKSKFVASIAALFFASFVA